uniref:AraC family transcriptional regulator n=1 Tax=Myxococcus xanthus TaxID=34 RepID=A0A1P8VQB6_MYXXA|nr:AraC family transcriptional regulator [Myxococcus xanthus]
MVAGAPDARLRGVVAGPYWGYDERTPGPMRRRELPSPQVVLIIDFGPWLRILDPRDACVSARHKDGFVAGLDDSFSITETSGAMRGLQVNFTPVGARLFFGMPLRDLARRVVGLRDLLGPQASLLSEQLQASPDWAARFALLDQLLLKRIHEARAIAACVPWAWERLVASGGGAEIGGLAGELGYSQKHLITRFNEELGMPPKLLARLLRFDQVIQRLRTGGVTGTWAELALAHGYYDQAHFNRDFRQFTGLTPREYVRLQLPDHGGLRGD